MAGILSTALACLLLAACGTGKTDDRGYQDAAEISTRITAGTSTRDDVLAALGSPSTQSDFGEESWYYIRSAKESVAFFKPKITEQEVTRIIFDESGVVKKIETYTLDQSKDIAIVNRITPTEGHKLGMIEQIVGNLGRFNKDPKTGPASKRR